MEKTKDIYSPFESFLVAIEKYGEVVEVFGISPPALRYLLERTLRTFHSTGRKKYAPHLF